MSYFFISKQLLWELFFRISNSKSLKSKIVNYDNLTLSSAGHYSLKVDGLSLERVVAASIASYQAIKPAGAINVYAHEGVAYIFGEPEAVISGLRVKFRSL